MRQLWGLSQILQDYGTPDLISFSGSYKKKNVKVREMSSKIVEKTTIILSSPNWSIPLLSLKLTHWVGQNCSGNTVDAVTEMQSPQRAESFKT